LISDGAETTVGSPVIEGAGVTAKVLGEVKGDKVRVFKMKPKKRYQKTQGHRQQFIELEITDIKSSGAKKPAATKKPTEKKPAAAKKKD